MMIKDNPIEIFVKNIKEALDLNDGYDIFSVKEFAEKLGGKIIYTNKLRIGVRSEIKSIKYKDNKASFVIAVKAIYHII